MDYLNSVLLIGSSVSDSVSALGRSAFFVGIGLLVILLLVVRFELLHAAISSGESAGEKSKTNCPSCGARTTIESNECDHCGSHVNR